MLVGIGVTAAHSSIRGSNELQPAFRVGVTRDFLKPDGTLGFSEIGLELLYDPPRIVWEFLAENVSTLRADMVREFDALLVLGTRIAAETVDGVERLLHVARFGVGFDSVDVPACSRNGVVVSITPDAVRRPVATIVMTFMLALAHKLLVKDRLTRSGDWSERPSHMGLGLSGRTLGVIGLGNIGREVFALARPFEMRHLGYDPYVADTELKNVAVERAPLETLLRQSDFVAICCTLNDETHHLLNAESLALMKPSAYLINVARGPIVDEPALIEALRNGRIQGAGLDVYEHEPVDPLNPLLTMGNVLVTPHSLCWTDECFQAMGRSACRSILDIAGGRIPQYVINREATTHVKWQTRLTRSR